MEEKHQEEEGDSENICKNSKLHVRDHSKQKTQNAKPEYKNLTYKFPYYKFYFHHTNFLTKQNEFSKYLVYRKISSQKRGSYDSF